MHAHELFTLAEAADRLGLRNHQVRHIIESRGIEAVAKKANVRLYDGEAFERIAAEARRIADQRNVL